MAFKRFNYADIDKINYQSRISRLMFGIRTPPLLVKIQFYYGIVGWFYFFIWYLAAFLSIKSINGIAHPEQIKANFNKIGLDYGIDNFQITFGNTLGVLLVCLGVVFVSLFMIYRRMIIGYYIYLGAWILGILIMLFTLGFSFFWKENTHLDKPRFFR